MGLAHCRCGHFDGPRTGVGAEWKVLAIGADSPDLPDTTCAATIGFTSSRFGLGVREMARITLEQRVAELERMFAALLANHGATSRAKDWRRTLGAFTGDEVMKEFFAEGRKIRQVERQRARSARRKARPARS
jgi:hypothetical protein